jgi:hypothetical protein
MRASDSQCPSNPTNRKGAFDEQRHERTLHLHPLRRRSLPVRLPNRRRAVERRPPALQLRYGMRL